MLTIQPLNPILTVSFVMASKHKMRADVSVEIFKKTSNLDVEAFLNQSGNFGKDNEFEYYRVWRKRGELEVAFQ